MMDRRLIFSGALVLATAACSSSGGDATTSGAGTTSGGGGGAACHPTTVPCSDEVILQMALQSSPVEAQITSTPDGAGWTSQVDATAGGAFATTPTSFTYGKFTDQGLTKVDISDIDSLDSMDWD